MKNLRNLILVVIIFVAGFLVGQSVQAPTSLTPPANQAADVSAKKVLIGLYFAPEQVSFYPIEWREDLTALTATQALAGDNDLAFKTQDYGELGTLITQIGAKVNGDGNSYWQYWVNKDQVQVAANAYVLQPQDILEWKFTKSEL